ncbi:DUF2793 domain-containing protein [Sphingomonas gei]|uniref:DUF2793 domain-containing protein n=1 Tax=Sphingomonas gei TaxID=1395960 RepID=A0A4S1XE14_9SPHN|nr:DUF2793 domain-containing protein [Sphingomonas gei]TGX54769.1 DUF2793 domain-containing protein [Sphingomonas gei]
MTEETTPRLALPLLQPGQAQKEMTHNEALALLDLGVHAAVIDANVDTPPASPVPGACWLLGAAPVDAWAGHPRALAGWSTSGWYFFEPHEGMQVWLGPERGNGVFSGGVWRLGAVHGKLFVEGDQVVGPRAAAIMEPSGGMTVDGEARAAIVSVLEALRTHGLIQGG